MSGPKRGAIAVTSILRVALDITDLSNGGTVLEVNRGGVARVFGDMRRQIAI